MWPYFFKLNFDYKKKLIIRPIHGISFANPIANKRAHISFKEENFEASGTD